MAASREEIDEEFKHLLIDVNLYPNYLTIITIIKPYIEDRIKEYDNKERFNDKFIRYIGIFTINLIEKLIRNSVLFIEYKKHITIDSRTVQSSIRSCLSGYILKHTISVGTQRVIRFYDDENSILNTLILPIDVVKDIINIITPTLISKNIRVSKCARVFLITTIEYLINELIDVLHNNHTINNNRELLTLWIDLKLPAKINIDL